MSLPKFSLSESIKNLAQEQKLDHKLYLATEQKEKVIYHEGTYVKPPPIPADYNGIPETLPKYNISDGLEQYSRREGISQQMNEHATINSYIQTNLVPVQTTTLAAINPKTNAVQIHEIHKTTTPATHPEQQEVKPETKSIADKLAEIEKKFGWDDDFLIKQEPESEVIIPLPIKGIEEVIRYLPSRLDLSRGINIEEAYQKILNKSQRRKDTTKYERDLLKDLANRLNLEREKNKHVKVELPLEFQQKAANLGKREYRSASGLDEPIEKEQRSRDLDHSAGKSKSRQNAPFGRYLIDMKQLGSGVLSIQNSRGKSIPHLPKRAISKNLRNAIYSASQGKTPNTNFLTSEELDFFRFLADKSRVYDHLYFTENESLIPPKGSSIQTELDVMFGEIAAGNDNPRLKQRISGLITYLYNNTNFPKKQLQYWSRKYLV